MPNLLDDSASYPLLVRYIGQSDSMVVRNRDEIVPGVGFFVLETRDTIKAKVDDKGAVKNVKKVKS